MEKLRNVDLDLLEGYQPSLAGLKGKDGKPLVSLNAKDLKPPKGGTAIRRPGINIHLTVFEALNAKAIPMPSDE